MSEVVRRCLGCSNTYPLDEHACPECGSHAADVEDEVIEATEPKAEPKRPRRRKT
jgi:rRNA maturation endonuclease Nob1